MGVQKNKHTNKGKAVRVRRPKLQATTPRTPKVAAGTKLTAFVHETFVESGGERRRHVSVLVDGYCSPQKQRFKGNGGFYVNGSIAASKSLKKALRDACEDAVVYGGDAGTDINGKVTPFKWEDDVVAEITFTYAVPTGRDDLVGRFYRGHIVDLSNLQKLAEDALQGILLVDDAQLVKVTTTKTYGKKNEMYIRLQAK
jgi:hypothetical protein